MPDYQPKTAPYAHQTAAFERSKDAAAFALFLEQRTGKTKIVIDTAARLYELGQITALLVVAMPGRVHANWAANEIPPHMPDRIPRQIVVWSAAKAGQKGFKEKLEALLTTKSLAILLVNGEAIITSAFRQYAEKFLKARRTIAVADESSLSTRNWSKRTKVMHAIARRSAYRRILDGTPVGEGPLDLYYQMAFLDPSILGFTSFYAFKQRYAVWEKKTNHAQGREYEELKCYQNLDELTARIAPYSFQVLRKDCFDMPEKVYQKYTYELSPEQRRVYDTIAEEYKAELSNSEHVTAQHVLTRYLRLQQILSNFWPPEKAATIHEACQGAGCADCEDLGVIVTTTATRLIDPKHDPRLDAMADILAINPRPGIVWARFHHDVDALLALASRTGRRAARYDGLTSPKDKDAAQAAFQGREIDLLIGNPRSGGRGLRLDAAQWITYFSNDFSLLSRLQSEDRAEAPGRTGGTGIIDIIAADTIDDTLVDALRNKKSLADEVLGREKEDWI